MRTVPCIAGCDGPMLRCIGSDGELELALVEVEIDAAPCQLSPSIARGARRRALAAERHALVAAERRELLERHAGLGFGAVRDERLRALGRVVLAERVPLELRVHEDAAQIGVAREA